jgi:hypothetical protein
MGKTFKNGTSSYYIDSYEKVKKCNINTLKAWLKENKNPIDD